MTFFHYGTSFGGLLYVRTSVFWFLNDNLSKCQWIFTKLVMCIDSVNVWVWIANRQVSSNFFCLPHDSGMVLLFHIIFCFSLNWYIHVMGPVNNISIISESDLKNNGLDEKKPKHLGQVVQNNNVLCYFIVKTLIIKYSIQANILAEKNVSSFFNSYSHCFQQKYM